MSSVLVAVIHHGEFAGAPVAEVVRHLTDSRPTWEVREFDEQAPLAHEPKGTELIAWARTQWDLEREWRIHRGVQSWWRQVVAELGLQFWRLRIKTSARFREHAWHIREVETRVTAKHIAAWRALLDTPSCSVLVLESDAAWIAERSLELLSAIERLPEGPPAYLNLAGGLSEFHIRISKVDASRDSSGQHPDITFVDFTVPVTNTSCAYAVNRPLAERLLTFVHEHPGAESLGVDWLVNAAFIHLRKQNISLTCVHGDPPLLLHGSLTGITRSWHPDR